MRSRVPPSPHDVLIAIKEIDAKAHEIITSLNRDDFASSLRRTSMAACRAFGHSYPKIAKAFSRDHSTVMSACDAYMRRQVNPKDVRSSLFERTFFLQIIKRANEVSDRRCFDPGGHTK